MFYKIVLPNSKILTITVSTTSYEAGMIVLLFHPLFNQVKELREKLNKVTNIPLMQMGAILLCSDIANLRSIVNCLTSEGMIVENDKSQVGALGQQVDKILQQRSSLKHGADKAQSEVLLSVAEVYIEDIIDNCKDYSTAIKLLRAAFYPNCLQQQEGIKSFLKENSIEASVMESVIALWKVCHGEANLETSLLRMDIKTTLPSLLAQRNKLFTSCVEKIKTKFTGLDDQNQLYMILGLLIFKAEGQELSPLADTNIIIKNALIERSESITTRQVFTGVSRPGTMSLTTEAFGHMGILRKDDYPDTARIENLRKEFNNSPLLGQYLQLLEGSKQGRKVDAENPLLQALNDKDKEAAAKALQTTDVNQYFSDGRTPLIVAIQQCGKEIVELILQRKPDLNKRNSLGYFAPIFSAIIKQSPKILELLLDAGADVMLSSCVQRVQYPTFVKQQQITAVPPLTYVATEYQKERKEIYADMLKLLFKYGAGIGLQVNPFFAQLISTVPGLDQIMMIGGTCSFQTPFKVITTAAEFKQHVDKKEYPHWQKVFENRLQHRVFNNPKLYKELELIVNHIQQTLKNESSDNNRFSSSPIKISSPITPGEDAHKGLMNRIKEFYREVGNTRPGEFKAFLEAVSKKNYPEALREACRKLESVGLVEILLSYKEQLPIGIDERDKDDYTAAFYAAMNKNKEAYNLLVENGANVALNDNKGISVEEYARENLKLEIIRP